MRVIRRRRGWLEPVSVLALVFFAVACPGPRAASNEIPAVHTLPADGSKFDLAAFNKFLKDNDYKLGNLHKQTRNAKACKKCVEVEIQSIGLTTDIDETTAPAEDRVVAVFRNKDKTYTEDMYGIEPEDKAEYYLWISGGTGGPARWTVVGFEKQSGGQAITHHARKGSFKRCDYGGTTKISEADFMSCVRAHPAPTVNKSEIGSDHWLGLVRASFLKIFQTGDTSLLGDDPAWLRCVNGCCTASTS